MVAFAAFAFRNRFNGALIAENRGQALRDPLFLWRSSFERDAFLSALLQEPPAVSLGDFPWRSVPPGIVFAKFVMVVAEEGTKESGK